MKALEPLAKAQVERRLKPLRKNAENTRIRDGWIHYMRAALGITLENLARRAGVSKSTVAQTERREVKGNVTLETLRKMANAMECDLIYAFVPRKEIGKLLDDRAREKARTLIFRADTHMTLENQKVHSDLRERIDRLADALIKKGDVW